MILKRFSIVLAVAALTTLACSPTNSQEDFGHFHPKGKQPSEHTLKIFEEAQQTLPFSDRWDFEEWERGFIARREDPKIMADAGNVAWDMERYLFQDEQEQLASVHPSIMSMSGLNKHYDRY